MHFRILHKLVSITNLKTFIFIPIINSNDKMKKYYYLLTLVLLATACTRDDSPNYESTEIFTNTTTSINLDAVYNGPDQEFDNSSEGIYLGTVVTTDFSLHGKIWINVANDNTYKATIHTDNLEEILFVGEPSSENEYRIQFEGNNGMFTYDVSDFTNPQATDIKINGVEGHIQTVKDRSTQRANAILGTYEDDNDPSFTGSWDLITDGSTTGTAFGYPALTEVHILSPSGVMYVIDEFTPFAFPCFDINGDNSMDANDITIPVFHSAGGSAGDINEFWAQDQTASINGIELTYSLGQSSTLSQNGFGNTMFINNDLASPPSIGCFVIPGKKGIWSWNGREGSVFFDDPFDN